MISITLSLQAREYIIANDIRTNLPETLNGGLGGATSQRM